MLSERFKGRDVSSIHDQLRQRGIEFGIVFGNRTLLSNSRLALEVSEYARDMGKHDSFHKNIFHAYFTEALDIGSLEVISDVAQKSGLDADGVLTAIKDDSYSPRLDEAREEGRLINLTGVPIFIINGKYKIVGAQPVEVFKEVFSKGA